MQITALTLVNRLLRRHRIDDVSTFTSPEAKLALDLINTAIRQRLSERDYPWNIRHDGYLYVQAPFAQGNLAMTNESTSATISGTTAIAYIAGQWVARLLPYGHTEFNKQSIKVVSATVSGANVNITLGAVWPGANTGLLANTKWRLDINEYQLPDTVAKVISVRHEQTPLTVVQVDPGLPFDLWNPSPSDVQNDFPYVVGVGGTVEVTYNTASVSSATRGLRMMVWPIPDSYYLLNYSYKERLDELSAVTDSLYAPDEFADDVVDLAESKSYAGAFGNDPDLANAQMRMAEMSTQRKYGNSRVDPQRRHVVGAHDSGNNRRRDPTKYRSITGL